jgi:predicted SpoU family rRNA methylase
VRRFLSRFDGRELEVALEATTGWRFVVEELRRVGAVVHLAEPGRDGKPFDPNFGEETNR